MTLPAMPEIHPRGALISPGRVRRQTTSRNRDDRADGERVVPVVAARLSRGCGRIFLDDQDIPEDRQSPRTEAVWRPELHRDECLISDVVSHPRTGSIACRNAVDSTAEEHRPLAAECLRFERGPRRGVERQPPRSRKV